MNRLTTSLTTPRRFIWLTGWRGLLLLVVLLLLGGLISGQTHAQTTIDRADLVNVNADTAVNFSGIVHNRRARRSTTNGRIDNTSAISVATPLILVIESISDPSVTVANADGTTLPDGKPYFDFSGQVPGDTLDPSEATSTRPLQFNNPQLRRFTLQTSVFQQNITSAAPSVSLEIPADSQGRKLIGIGEGVMLTIRAEGTDPVTVDLGQAAAAAGSRGVVLFGDPEPATTATVTTSGGANNSAQIRVRGETDHPSAFHGDLNLTVSVGGTEVATEPVTVLRIAVDLTATTLVNDMTAVRTITTTPFTSGLDVSFQTFRGRMEENIGVGIPEAESLGSVTFTPVEGSNFTTGENGLISYLVQSGYVGQGWVFGSCRIDEIGAETKCEYDLGIQRICEKCCQETGCESTDGCSSTCADGNYISLFSGADKLCTTDLSIPGRGFDYQFSRCYHSQVSQLRSVATNDFGVDWGFSYSDDRLIQDGNNVVKFHHSVRTDVFVASGTEGEFLAPQELYQELRLNDEGNFEIRDQNGMLKTYAGFDDPEIPGRLIRMEDSNGNVMRFLNSVPTGLSKPVLTTVVDTMGRNIHYRYYPNTDSNPGRRGRVQEIEDFRRDNSPSGRKVTFDYDAEGNLTAVTSPTVAGTPNGNDFPAGKTYRYEYRLDADIPLTVTGIDRERLRHNLLSIEHPNETAVDLDIGNPQTLPTASGTKRQVIVYGIDPVDPETFDRVKTYTLGGTNGNGVPAGGTMSYQYQFVAPNAVTTNDPFLQTRVTDRRSNVTEYVSSPFDTLLEKREFTRGLRNNEPNDFVTRYRYNIDKELLQITLPEGNIIDATFDQNNLNRFQQGNQTRSVRTPDARRGGDQAALFSESVYEPLYNQPAAVTDSRGLDPAFVPPIPDVCGRTQRERYTSRYFFDYQEANAAIILPLLAEELGVSEFEVQDRLNKAGIQLGLGDLNGDGDTSVRIAGNLVRKADPSVVLLDDSNQAWIAGDSCQDIVTLYRYNTFGQPISMVDPEANTHTYTYFPETDPDGDGTISDTPADDCSLPGASLDCRMLDTATGGYLEKTVRDTSTNPIRNNMTNPPPVNIRMALAYDDVGNRTSMTDGRGIRTDYFVNELNQVVQTKRAAAVPSSGQGVPEEPLPLLAFAYMENVFYDFNNNQTKREVQDLGNTSDTGGFVDYTYQYDLLDNVIEQTDEVDVAETLVTRYRYDANENRALVIQPEGNATRSLYDERDLLFQTTRSAQNATTETLGVSAGPFNPRGGVPSTLTYNYDWNENQIEGVDAANTDGSTANNSLIAGIGDSTMVVYDGFDRRITSVDAVGNRATVNYDPVSNAVRESRFGPVGGASPQNMSGTDNVLLSQTEQVYDELNRKFQQDRVLFVSTGVSTQRPPDVSDSDLTPNDNKITMRYEYDRKSRQTFYIQDDLDTYQTDYDGTDRKIKEFDSEGNIQEYAYDDNNNVIESRETDISQVAGLANEIFLTTYFYDSLNRVQQQVDNIGQTHFYRYDSRDNQVAMADAEGPMTGATITRRAFSGGLLTVNDINDFGNVTLYEYDGINRKTREDRVLTANTQGDGANIGVDLFGVKTTTPIPDPSQSTDGLITVRYDWDKNSLLTSLTDDNGNQTRYSYDNLNRRLTETKGIVVAPALANRDDPDTTIAWKYDPDDNVETLTDENGSVWACLYDAINRRIGCDITRAFNVIGTTAETYEYDGLSRLALATDNNEPAASSDDSVISYAYDSLSRVVEETQKIGGLDAKVISSDWLAENLRTGLIYPNDRQLEYTYDRLDRLNTVADTGATLPIADYDYLGVNRVAERAYPLNGTRMTYLNDAGNTDIGYDGLRRPVQLRHLRANNSQIVGFTHTYDRMNNKRNEPKGHDNSNSEIYNYDSVYRVVDFERGQLNAQGDSVVTPSPNALQRQRWNLDGLGNWRDNDITEGGVLTAEDREHSSFNELISTRNGAPVALVYDDNGNLINDGTLLFEWDYRNRLKRVRSASTGNPLVATYAYDAANRRIRKDVAGSAEISDFYYDGWRVLEERDGADGVTQQYVFGNYLDEVLTLDKQSRGLTVADLNDRAGSDRHFYHQNTLYHVYSLTDETGAIAEAVKNYDAYGKVSALITDPGTDTVWFTADDVLAANPNVSAIENPWFYTGQRVDPEASLMYYKNRYYSVELGRFVSRDPIGYESGINLYEYVASSPFKYHDPFGKIRCCSKWAYAFRWTNRLYNTLSKCYEACFAWGSGSNLVGGTRTAAATGTSTYALASAGATGTAPVVAVATGAAATGWTIGLYPSCYLACRKRCRIMVTPVMTTKWGIYIAYGRKNKIRCGTYLAPSCPPGSTEF